MLNGVRKIIRNILILLGIREAYLKHIIYNSFFMAVLAKINYLRWREIDIILIMWPPASPLFNEINEYILQYHDIKSFEIVQISDDKFEKFIYKLYEIDFANPRKVALKIDLLLNSPIYNLGVIKIRINKPKMQVQDILNRVRCESVGELKDRIRKKYKHRIPNYTYDVIIHSTEVNYQNKEVLKILKKYACSKVTTQ